MVVAHSFIHADDRKIGMLLPLGEYKHRQLLDYEVGEVVSDPEGREARIMAKATVLADSELADCLSVQLYGRRIDTVRRKMEEKWEIADDRMLLLIVELI